MMQVSEGMKRVINVLRRHAKEESERREREARLRRQEEQRLKRKVRSRSPSHTRSQCPQGTMHTWVSELRSQRMQQHAPGQ
jgi:hypothetical protein